LTAEGTMIEEVAIGNGSVDAIYKAIDRAIGESVELQDYNIQSVTDGKDALGEVSVVLAQNGLSVKGRGVSTDILEASARAYVDSINRLIDKRKTFDGSRRDVTLI
ncbi:MAG: 2-isopropylmalate synthase, partial [Gorillibacterium sp.]|nr:2-isopropylmalate synthase [Gorillibacterium sp.]